MRILIAIAAMVAGCGVDHCENASIRLRKSGFCVVGAEREEIGPGETMDARVATSIAMFADLDGRELSGDADYFIGKNAAIVFDSREVKPQRNGNLWITGDTFYVGLVPGMSEPALYWSLSHELMHAHLHRWTGSPGVDHPEPFFDTSYRASGWDSIIFEKMMLVE